MIINILRGGLGNQLFQWVFTKRLEIKYNIPVYMDLSNLSVGGVITDRVFELNQFPNLKYNILNNENVSKYSKNQNISLIEGTFDSFNVPIENNTNYSFMGYWQNYFLLEEISEIIKNDLYCGDDKKLEIFNKYPELNSNTVSLHVRRTDYLTSNGFHPVQPISYYEKALDIIGEYDNLFIFSDDIEWCKNNMKFKNQIFVENNISSVDIWLMSFCKNNIIANSTFSWWGAWLNENKDKKIIKPYSWINSGPIGGLTPDDWISI